MKRITSFILVLVMIISVFAVLPVAAEGVTVTGYNVTLNESIYLNFHYSNDEVKHISVAAKDMDKTVTEPTYGASGSVYGYAQGILNGDYNDSAKELVTAMLSYGAAAQKYFYNATEGLVGTPLSDVTDLMNADVNDAVAEIDGFIGASLILEGSILLRFYFAGTDKVINLVTGEDYEELWVEPSEDETYSYVEFEVYANKLDEVFTLECDGKTVSYSALNYLQNKANDPALTEMVASIYAYHLAAKSYREGPLTPLEELQRTDIDTYEYPLDQIEEVIATIAYNSGDSKIDNYYVYNEGKTVSLLIDITGTTFDSIDIEVPDHDNPYMTFAFLAEEPVLDQPVKYAEGYCTYKAAWTFDFTVDIPKDAKYLIIRKMDGDWDCSPSKMTFKRGTTTIENIQNTELDTYEFPIQNLVFDHACIDMWMKKDKTYWACGDKDTNGNNKENWKVALVDITDCAFDYVTLIQDSSFAKQLGWTFLSEMPSYRKEVKWATGYSNFKWSEDNADNDGNKHTEKNIVIPEDANYLVLYYMESYYEPGDTDKRYYPNSITFHNTKK